MSWQCMEITKVEILEQRENSSKVGKNGQKKWKQRVNTLAAEGQKQRKIPRYLKNSGTVGLTGQKDHRRRGGTP